MEELCPFCAELADPTYYQRKINPGWPFPEGRVMYRNDGTMVIPGHGPQVYPYALVIPFAHESSFADLSDLSEGQRQSVFSVLDWLTDLPVFGGDVCVFEHGGGPDSTCQCIEHCHLHVVPGRWTHSLQRALSTVVAEEADPIAIDVVSFEDMPSGYLFVGDYCRDSRRFIGTWVVPKKSEPQLLRRLFAGCLGQNWWDWRSPKATANQELMERLYAAAVFD